MSKTQVSGEQIGAFLEGGDPQKYIVAIEAPYFQNTVTLVVNDPEQGKYTQQFSYKPFMWMKHEMASIMYDGDRSKIKTAMRESNIKITELKTADENGFTPSRLKNGYKYLVKCDGSYTQLISFFKNGGVDPFHDDFRKYFMTISPTEQFLIQTGKRLFKGFEEYEELHRLQFDLETTGLHPRTDSIFQIGIKDNRGYEKVIEVKADDALVDAYEKHPEKYSKDEMVQLKSAIAKQLRDSERKAITEFFDIIDKVQPDLIAGYNSENFDWDFIFVRCEILGMDITKVAKTLDGSKISRKDSQLKLGGSVEHYQQTKMWGTNIIDVMHSVRRAQAINSDIKKAGLKYITKFSKIAKPNRVYVEGDKIHKTWNDRENKFYLNETNGEWFKFDTENLDHLEKIASDDYKEVTGAYIVQRYLIDDLWETEQIDARFNQATFLLGKMIPTSYMRSSTMGTAGIWKLIMMAWSYENNLAVPELQPQGTFTGGLSRLLEVGFAKNVAKADYAALYPNTEITHDIFPDIDISGVMKGMLLFIAETRDVYKALKGEHEDKAKAIKTEIDANKEIYSKKKLAELEKERQKELGLADKFDKKQLPIKILANSFFGAYGAPHIFPWGDLDCAEETTCRGRQYLRLMVKYFTDKHQFRALVMDTDGVNFAMPDEIADFKFTPKGSHKLTIQYAGKEISGVTAAVARFNEEFMVGRMGLDIDAICDTTINFARKNYANNINGKIKLVGNTIKSKKMPIYIEEFLDEGIKLLLAGKGYEFIELYNKKVEIITNYEVPLVKIASKSSIRKTMDSYKAGFKKTNKAGNPMPRQAHMELALQHNLDLNLGDTIYYVNIGTTKSQGDIKTVKKLNGGVEVELMCKLIPTEQIENNPDLTTDEYNAPKYLAAFNKRIKPLLVCFDPSIRNKILMDYKKNTKTKEMEIPERQYFTHKECELTSGQPYVETDQDKYDDLMKFEDKEMAFWVRVDKVPNHTDIEEWKTIKADFIERMKKERIDGIANEKLSIQDIIKRLEIEELEQFREMGQLPRKITMLLELDATNTDDIAYLVSKKYGNDIIIDLEDLFEFEEDAIEREKYYLAYSTDNVEYEDWVALKGEPSQVEQFTPNFIETRVGGISEDDEIKMEEQLNLGEDEDDDWGF